MESGAFEFTPDGWVHLVSMGEHPWKSADGERRVLQVIDNKAVDSIRGNFEPELLLDYDHESHDPKKRTTAAGWVTEVEGREDGLWGKVRWSDCGLEDVSGGNYRFVSPTFDLKECDFIGTREGYEVVRPLRLSDAALTNRPNLRGMVALTNREVSGDVADGEIQHKEISKMVDMDQVMEHLLPLLALPEGVSEESVTTEQILEALRQLADAKSHQKLQEKAEGLEEELVNRILDENELNGEVREAWRGVLLSNREQGARALMFSRTVSGGRKGAFVPMHNRSRTGMPSISFSGCGHEVRQREAIRHYQEKNHCSYRDAFNAVQQINPEFFK